MNIRDLPLLNGPIMIKVEEGVISVYAHQHETRIPYVPQDQPESIEKVIGQRRGRMTYHLTSDIYDCFDLNFKEKRMDAKIMRDVFALLLESSIQFIARISKEEALPILIQNSFEEDRMYFLSTIGLLDDARVIFAEIKPRTSMRKGKVNDDA